MAEEPAEAAGRAAPEADEARDAAAGVGDDPPAAGASDLDLAEVEDEYDGYDERPDELGRAGHFARLAFHPVTLSYGTIAAFAVFSVLVVLAGPIAAAAGAIVVFAIAYAIVFVIAGRRAAANAYEDYAAERGLSIVPEGSLSEATPLLRRGDRRSAAELISGVLPGGVDGTLALYTYEVDADEAGAADVGENDVDVAGSGEHEDQVYFYDHTVVVTRVAGSPLRLGALYCERKTGSGGATDAGRPPGARALQLGNWAFDARYSLSLGGGSDDATVRRLLPPRFVTWLVEEAPPDIAFEMVAESLTVSVEGHLDPSDELDELCEAAAAVAATLRGEPFPPSTASESDGQAAESGPEV